MDAMNFNDELNRVLKYGRAPEADLLAAAKTARDEHPIANGQTVNDARIQDFLQEHGDPRELIVRKHRENYDAEAELEKMLGGPRMAGASAAEIYKTPEGELHFYHHHNGDRHAVRADWFITETNGPRNEWGSVRSYNAALTPEEVEHIKQNLPDAKLIHQYPLR